MQISMLCAHVCDAIRLQLAAAFSGLVLPLLDLAQINASNPHTVYAV